MRQQTTRAMRRPADHLNGHLMLSFFILVLMSAFTSRVWARTLIDDDGDRPAGVYIRNLIYAGSGCPAGSVAQNMADDAHAFTLAFDSFIAEVGPDVPFSSQRKNCQIAIDLAVPQGWSFSIVQVDYRGYLALEHGLIGTQKASYYFQGETRTGHLQTNFYGPVEQDYQARDTIAVERALWSPCGVERALSINSQVRIDNSYNTSGRGVMTVDSIDAQVTQIYGLQWRRCR